MAKFNLTELEELISLSDNFRIVCTTESGRQQKINVGNVGLESAVLTMHYLRECNPTKGFRLVGNADKFQGYVNELCPE